MCVNKLSLNILCGLIILLVIGVAGRYDYNEEVIYNISDNTYRAIKAKVGNDCSDTELVNEYQKNKIYWDNINGLPVVRCADIHSDVDNK